MTTGLCSQCGAKLSNVEARLTTRAHPEDAGVSDYFHLATLCTNEACPTRHRQLADLLSSADVGRLIKPTT